MFSKLLTYPDLYSIVLRPPFINVRCFRFVKQMYLEKF
jgi:hypothetical protein